MAPSSPSLSPALPAGRRKRSLPPAGALYEHRTMFCGACGMARVFHRRKMQPRLHFVITLATVGLWLPVWGALILFQALKPWICASCGETQRHDGRALSGHE